MKIIKASVAVILLLTALSLLFGCGGRNTDADPGTNKNDGYIQSGEPKDVYVQTVSDIAQYKIVRPDKGDVEKKALVALRTGFQEKLGIDLKVGTDFDGAAAKEILIGNTSREESKGVSDGLRSGDFKIRQKGEKIVIVGGSDKALMDAVDFAVEYLMSTERNSFAVPVKEGFTKRVNYISDKISVEGVDISEFKIASEYYTELDPIVERIQNEVIGVTLETTKLIAEGEHYIIVDNTGLVENEYSVKVENGNVVIKGSYSSIDEAIDYCFTDFLKNNGGKNVSLKNGAEYKGQLDKKQIYTKDQLMTVLTDTYNDPEKFIVGQQAEEINHPLPGESLTAFADATGELPGMLGVDLGCYGMYIKDYNEAQWSQAICELVEYASQGGIVEISSHYDNPADPSQWVRGTLGEFTTQAELDKAFTDLITEGTEFNEFFKEMIARDGRFLQALRDNGVPVLWRPLHEMNGSWFWFCATSNKLTVSAETWTNVWKYIHDYYTNELKLDNLIWVYSPNVSSNENDQMGTTMSTMYCFPGKEYCDIVGTDWYFTNTATTTPAGYKELIDATGYIGALTEVGPSGALLADPETSDKIQSDIFSCSDFDAFLNEISKAGNKFAYVLAWSSKWSIPTMGEGDEFMALDYTLGAADLRAIFDSMK